MNEDGVEIATTSLAPRIAQILRMMQFQFSKFRLGHPYLQEFEGPLLEATRSHLNELYTELLAPIRPKVKGRRLIVVPHELLHYVPFHALFDGDLYLIDAFTVSYAPSASIYMQHRRKQVNRTGCSLILGIPDRQAPSIYEELQAVAEVVPQAKVFLGTNANEAVLKENGPRSRLIHIATHGFFRQDNPMFSGIRLGQSSLTLYDLYNLKLPAELVTLSGCSTGLNVIAAGDELIGLVRGLLSAGAQSLLLTLWDVNDSSTADFMKAFYSRLFNHPDRALALREAMVEIRQRYPHPYYWAPFILVA
jgi:CHAT domain-containing protein